MIVEISTDGSAEPNPGPGGWAAILRVPQKAIAIYGHDPATTNNRMELTAAINALERLSHGKSTLIIYSDSQYLINGITGWIINWRKKDYVGIMNTDLWKRLDKATTRHKSIQWKWIKGHTNHQDNILADKLATRARELRKSGEETL